MPRARRSFLGRIEVADLVTSTDDGLVATFLPLIFAPEVGERGAMLGHVARKNDQWKRTPRGEALVIAHGVDAYISPSWYATKAEHGRVVPTWDYTTAHVYGQLQIHDDVGVGGRDRPPSHGAARGGAGRSRGASTTLRRSSTQVSCARSSASSC